MFSAIMLVLLNYVFFKLFILLNQTYFIQVK